MASDPASSPVEADRDRGGTSRVPQSHTTGIRVRTTAVRPGAVQAARDTAIRASRSKRREAPCRALAVRPGAPRAVDCCEPCRIAPSIHTAFPQLAKRVLDRYRRFQTTAAEAPPNPLVKTSDANRGRLGIVAKYASSTEQVGGRLPTHHSADADRRETPLPWCTTPLRAESLP